jgi:pimeloyl-ACP methyl ester carboxylesterase
MPQTIASLPREIRERYPYTSRFLTVNGRRMHYIDEGDRDAPPVLLLHGNPTWGYLWRDVLPPILSAGLRAVVPDMIGMGLSEKPHDHRALTLDNHTADVVALLERLDLRKVTVVCHDWGGPTGLGAILTRPDRAAAVAVMSTWAWASPASEFHQRVMPWRYMHAPLIGGYLLGRHGAMPGRGMYLSVVDRDRFRAEASAGFEAVLDEPDKRAATWIWPRYIPIGRDSDVTLPRFDWLEAGVARLELPASVIWGREDDVFPAEPFARRWHELWPHAEGTHYVTGRHFLQEDSGAEIGELVTDFVRRVSRIGKAG